MLQGILTAGYIKILRTLLKLVNHIICASDGNDILLFIVY